MALSDGEFTLPIIKGRSIRRREVKLNIRRAADNTSTEVETEVTEPPY